MASLKIFFLIAALAVSVFPSSLATEFVVGDEKGWGLDFDYQAWAAGKEFRVGDTLVFKYKAGVHNVMKVNGSDFQNCEVSGNTVPLITGNDVITLAAPGKKWYICGVPGHCANRNMKLSITVLAQVGSPNLAPSPNSPNPSAASSSTSYGWVSIMLSFVGLLLV